MTLIDGQSWHYMRNVKPPVTTGGFVEVGDTDYDLLFWIFKHPDCNVIVVVFDIYYKLLAAV